MSTFVFSSSASISDITNILRSTDNVKTAASEIRKALLDVDFGLDDKFCDDQETLGKQHVPDTLLSFFATLFNKNKTSLLKQDRDLQIDDPLQDFADDIEDELLKIKSLFQILYYHITRGSKKTPLQLINAHAIYYVVKVENS